ncbi:MAG: LptE family protein [Candidatus Zixiibacteriota bacterium]
MNSHFLQIFIILVFIIDGCGVYTFNPKGKSSIKTIAVERFENQTSEYGLEDQMTDQVIDALIADGSLKIAAPENTDAVLSGQLTNYERKPYEYDENDLVQSYSVYMYFDITLKNPVNDSTIWKEKMNQIGIYDINTETEIDGQQRAIALLIEAIINKTTKSW